VRRFLPVLLVLPLCSSPAAAASRALPVSVQGLWAYEPGDCGKPDSDGLLTVEPRTVLFYATAYDVKRVTRMKDGTLKISGFVSSEGEAGRERGGLSLKLVAPDRLQVTTGTVHVYHRCSKPGAAAGKHSDSPVNRRTC
jgi:hypothetical protein